jgi:predicted  nucleic acid-binding Zn-ribbon protein
LILDYEQNISSLTEEVEQLRSEMHKISTMRKELNDLDTQRQKEHDDQENILRKLNQKLDKSEENNKVLSQK